jgi:hypothetical protein
MCYKLLAHAFWERNSLFITEQAYNQLRWDNSVINSIKKSQRGKKRVYVEPKEGLTMTLTTMSRLPISVSM